MQSLRRWVVIFLGVVLLLSAAWYVLHSTALPKSLSMAVYSKAAARPIAVAGNRAGPRGKSMNAVPESTKARARETVICEVGSVRLDSNDRVAPFNYVSRLTAAVQARWRRALIVSDDYHARAAGLLLQSKAWAYDSVSGMPTRTHDAELARDELKLAFTPPAVFVRGQCRVP